MGPALLVHIMHDTRRGGYVGSRRGQNLEIHERDLRANPKRLKRSQRNRSQSAAPMIIRFSIERLMLALIENKRRRVEPWRRARRLQTGPCTYERATEINESM